MILFIFGLLFIIGFVISLVVAAMLDKKVDARGATGRVGYRQGHEHAYDGKTAAKITAWCLLGVGLLMVFGSTVREVSTKNVGITTAFGKPTGELSNGLHVVAPWVNVTEMDAAIQTDIYDGDGNQGTCLNVRLAFQIVACVDTSIQWRIEPKQADYLFQNYRDFTNVREALVTRELNSALSQVMANYDPLALNANGTTTQPSLNTLAGQVQAVITHDIGAYIHVIHVFIPRILYGDSVQSQIDSLQKQVAATRIAQQAEQTNAAQSKANQELEQSVTNPNVLVSKCLDGVNNAIANGYQLPAGYNCFGGGSVVVPASK